MSCVVVVADEPDRIFLQQLHRELNRFFPSVLIWDQKLIAPKESAELILVDLQSVRQVLAEQQLIIYKRAAKADGGLVSSKGAIAIVDSSDTKLLEYISTTELPVVTCGLSRKDTITLSSIQNDSAVINLQRALHCLDNSVAEPQEIPVARDGESDNFVLMAACAVSILLGQSDRLINADSIACTGNDCQL